MVDGDIARCGKHPNKRLEYFCLSSEFSDRLFCGTCILKGNIPCKPSDLVDIDEYLMSQKQVLESKGCSQLPELSQFLADRKSKELRIKNNIQSQLDKFNEQIQVLENRIMNAFQLIRQSVEQQLTMNENAFAIKSNQLLTATNITFQNSLLGNYKNFQELICHFQIESPEGLLHLLTSLQEDAENREEQLLDRKRELQILMGLEREVISYKEEEIIALDNSCKVLEERIGKATMQIVTVISPPDNNTLGGLSQNISQINQSRFEKDVSIHGIDAIVSPKSNQSFFLNKSSRSARSAMDSPSNQIRVTDLRKIVCSADFVSGHTRQITAICAYGENKVATGGEDNCIRLWDLDKMECLECLRGHNQGIRDLIELPSNNNNNYVIASASYDKTIKLWNAQQGMLINTFKGHLAGVIQLLHLYNNVMASASADYTIKLWDINTGEALRTICGHIADVLCITKTNDQSQLLISGSADRNVIVWQLQKKINITPIAIHTLKGHTDYVSSLVVLQDNITLASASFDKSIILWNIKLGVQLAVMNGHKSYVNKLLLYADKIILSSSADSTLKLWDTNIKNQVHSLEGHEGSVNSFVILNDKSIWSVGIDKHVHVWD